MVNSKKKTLDGVFVDSLCLVQSDIFSRDLKSQDHNIPYLEEIE